MKEAFGKPGREPKWTHGNKNGIGTAYSSDSHLWFTIWKGHVTEVYYPTIDTPQIRDFQFLITDGRSFFHEEKKDLLSEIHFSDDAAFIYQITNSDPQNRYKIVKEVFSSPHLPSLLQKVHIEINDPSLNDMKLYALCEPHLKIGGKNNNAFIVNVANRQILMAEKEGTWLALAASIPFSKASCGYAGISDGIEDLKNFQMDWEFTQALEGNIALTGELPIRGGEEVVLVMTLGSSKQRAITSLLQTLGTPYLEHRQKYIEQWKRPLQNIRPLHLASQDDGHLYRRSVAILLAHEDKLFPGAFIASLSIPFGDVKGDKDIGGYHLVWTRDAVQTATALLATGNKKAPLRTLIYLTASQKEDGKFNQNTWINESPHAEGVQLDEIAFPILLAYYLHRENALEEFDPYPMLKKAAVYLIKQGPTTQQDRWEESIRGYSPSTLAAMIAAFICVANFAHLKGEKKEAEYFQEFADFLECHLDEWTVTTEGTLLPEIRRHYVRINTSTNGNINQATLSLPQRYPGAQKEFPVKEIVDAGFLQLVRYGIRKADDPLIIDSLKVIDQFLKVETPFGSCWRRYTQDGYGEQENGRSLENAGKGRAWPLLTGERGHYELDAKQDIGPYIKALEGFANKDILIAEQIWDAPDLPEAHMYLGSPTGSARPLAWAHAEYIKLLRSVTDGNVFDKIKEVEDRYLNERKVKPVAFWDFTYQLKKVKQKYKLRIQTHAHFSLKYTFDNWASFKESKETENVFDIYFLDIDIPENHSGSMHFTFFWSESNRYEGKNFEIEIENSSF